MKLLLINPPQAYNVEEEPYIVIPLGLGYIAAVLRKENMDIAVLDCIGEGSDIKSNFIKGKYLIGLNFKTIYKRIKEINPDIVLIGCSSSVQYGVMLIITKMVKNINRSTKIIVGGHHVSSKPKEVLKHKEIDYVVIGEGEKPIPILINKIGGNVPLGNIKSVGYKIKNKVIINNELDLEENLDTLPFPARDLFPFEVYASTGNKQSLIATNKRIAEIVTSRGCPYKCSFCSSHNVNGEKWRKRSVKNIIEEINFLKKRYNVNEIHFIDDNIILDKKRFVVLCNELRKVGIRWCVTNGITISYLNKNILRIMKKSGCFALFLPIETGNKKVLSKYLMKRIDFEHVKEISDYAHKLGFYQVGFFIIGFYEETKEDIEETIRFASSLYIDQANFGIVIPLPGTEYYNQVKYLITDYNYHTAKNANTDSKYLSKKEIENLRDKAYLYFEFNKLLKRPFSYFNKLQAYKLYRYMRYAFFRTIK